MPDTEQAHSRAEQYRERAGLLRSAAERLSPDGKRHLLDIAEEFERLAESVPVSAD